MKGGVQLKLIEMEIISMALVIMDSAKMIVLNIILEVNFIYIQMSCDFFHSLKRSMIIKLFIHYFISLFLVLAILGDSIM